MINIVEVHNGRNLQYIRQLFKEYANSLKISLDFQDFDQELAGLPGAYMSPDGCLLLADWDKQVAGCVALRKLCDNICEMKRLYIRPQFRGLGIGKSLAETVIKQAVVMGYSRMRLDTLPTMEAARAMYSSLGFKEVNAYCYNPIEGTVFMELQL